MTKHRHGTYSESYRAEISIPVATTLAGFVPGKEEYFVPRAHLKFPEPYNHDSMTKIIFPDIVRYKNELSSERSIMKHRESAKKLIYEVLPWLSTVLLQDGVLWMHHYPAISGVALLTSCMSKAQAITAFGSNYCNWVCTDGIRQLKELLNATIHNKNENENANDEIRTNITSLLNQQGEILKYMKNSNRVHHPSSSTSILPRILPSTPMQPTVNDSLNFTNVPVIPIIWNINQYETVKKLWSLREIHLHLRIESNPPIWLRPKGAKNEAGPLFKKKDQWCKIACIYAHIKKTFETLKNTKSWTTAVEAAEFLDLTERKRMTMNQYALYLKSQKRKKK